MATTLHELIEKFIDTHDEAEILERWNSNQRALELSTDGFISWETRRSFIDRLVHSLQEEAEFKRFALSRPESLDDVTEAWAAGLAHYHELARMCGETRTIQRIDKYAEISIRARQILETRGAHDGD